MLREQGGGDVLGLFPCQQELLFHPQPARKPGWPRQQSLLGVPWGRTRQMEGQREVWREQPLYRLKHPAL